MSPLRSALRNAPLVTAALAAIRAFTRHERSGLPARAPSSKHATDRTQSSEEGANEVRNKSECENAKKKREAKTACQDSEQGIEIDMATPVQPAHGDDP